MDKSKKDKQEAEDLELNSDFAGVDKDPVEEKGKKRMCKLANVQMCECKGRRA